MCKYSSPECSSYITPECSFYTTSFDFTGTGSSTPHSDLLRSYESLRKKPREEHHHQYQSPYKVPGFMERLVAELSPRCI